MECYRIILRISWKDMIRNEDVREIIEEKKGNNHRHYQGMETETIRAHM